MSLSAPSQTMRVGPVVQFSSESAVDLDTHPTVQPIRPLPAEGSGMRRAGSAPTPSVRARKTVSPGGIS